MQFSFLHYQSSLTLRYLPTLDHLYPSEGPLLFLRLNNLQKAILGDHLGQKMSHFSHQILHFQGPLHVVLHHKDLHGSFQKGYNVLQLFYNLQKGLQIHGYGSHGDPNIDP